MRLEIQDGYAMLDKDPQSGTPKITDGLRQIFLPGWFREALNASCDPAQVGAFEAVYLDEVVKQLKVISGNPQNWMDRGVPVGLTKMKIGSKTVPIKEIFLVSAAYSIPIYIAVSALVTGPATLILAAKAAAAVGPATAKLLQVINTYSPMELDVHTAVVAAMNRNHFKTLKGDGATLEEVTESFEQDSRLVMPANLEAVLDDMASESKRMLIRSLDGGVKVYKPNPY
jgi:hypothetical protein